MADLSTLTAAETIKIAGSDSSGAEQFFVRATADGDLGVADILNAAGVYGALTVGTSALELKVGASALSGRKFLTVQNLSSSDIYWGFNSSVTVSTGLVIPKKTERTFSVSDSVAVWVIGPNAGLDCRIAEAK